jgi:hypothetical protein
MTPTMVRVREGVRRVNRTPFHAMTVHEAQSAYVAATEALEVQRVALDRVEEFDPNCGLWRRASRLFFARVCRCCPKSDDRAAAAVALDRAFQA